MKEKYKLPTADLPKIAPMERMTRAQFDLAVGRLSKERTDRVREEYKRK